MAKVQVNGLNCEAGVREPPFGDRRARTPQAGVRRGLLRNGMRLWHRPSE